MFQPVQQIGQPGWQFGPILYKLRETLKLPINLVLHFTEPSVPAFLVAVTFVVVYALHRLVGHPSLEEASA